MEPEQEIIRELSATEKLLWSGRPRQGIVFSPADIFLVPFSMMWGGFAIFWESTALATGAPLFFDLWGIPFVVIGLYLIFGRFIVDKKQRQNTFYGVTSERVIIISGVFSRNTKSLNLRTLTDISLSEKSDHSGTITFGQQNSMYSFFGNSSWPGTRQRTPCFDSIENAKQVYNTITSSQKQT